MELRERERADKPPIMDENDFLEKAPEDRVDVAGGSGGGGGGDEASLVLLFDRDNAFIIICDAS